MGVARCPKAVPPVEAVAEIQEVVEKMNDMPTHLLVLFIIGAFVGPAWLAYHGWRMIKRAGIKIEARAEYTVGAFQFALGLCILLLSMAMTLKILAAQ